MLYFSYDQGVSKGDGNFFLFRAKNAQSDEAGYFCFPAGASESVLAEMDAANPDGKSSVDSECAEYQEDVDAMSFITADEVPSSITDFTNSSIILGN